MQNFIDAYSWINIRFLLEGLWITIEVSVISIIISFILGTFLGIIRYANIKYLSAIVGFIIDIIRNLPLLLIIFLHLLWSPEYRNQTRNYSGCNYGTFNFRIGNGC